MSDADDTKRVRLARQSSQSMLRAESEVAPDIEQAYAGPAGPERVARLADAMRKLVDIAGEERDLAHAYTEVAAERDRLRGELADALQVTELRTAKCERLAAENLRLREELRQARGGR
jgi:hypothetical protein